MSAPLPAPAEPQPQAAASSERIPPVIRLLSQAIARDPQAAVHYLLRGEEWLLRGELERARADFLRAQALAARDLARSDWGYINQAYRDRAEAGLRQCEPDGAATTSD